MRQQQPSSQTKKSSSQPLTRNSTTQPTLRGRALRLLGRREFSRQELDKRLRSFTEDPAELETLLDDLSERGWLSDARYADAVVRKRTGQYARRSIAQELKRAGVNEEVTAAALAQNLESDPGEEFAAALALCASGDVESSPGSGPTPIRPSVRRPSPRQASTTAGTSLGAQPDRFSAPTRFTWTKTSAPGTRWASEAARLGLLSVCHKATYGARRLILLV